MSPGWRLGGATTLVAAATGADTDILEYQAAARRRRARLLERLADELRQYGLACELTDDPWLRVRLSRTAGDTVYVKPHDGQDVFCWTSSRESTHPTMDPAGAARRIATQLRHEQSRAGRDCPLYQMRAAHLTLLGRALQEHHGHTCRLTTPDGMPVLLVRRNGSGDLGIIATLGYGDVDWFRYQGQGRDYIAPCGEIEDATEEVSAALRQVVAR